MLELLRSPLAAEMYRDPSAAGTRLAALAGNVGLLLDAARDTAAAAAQSEALRGDGSAPRVSAQRAADRLTQRVTLAASGWSASYWRAAGSSR